MNDNQDTHDKFTATNPKGRVHTFKYLKGCTDAEAKHRVQGIDHFFQGYKHEEIHLVRHH
jgi:inorganic pyrophosphatase